MRIFSLYFIIITSVVSFLLSCKSIDDVAVGIIEKGGEIPIDMRNSSFKVIGILKGKGNVTECSFLKITERNCLIFISSQDSDMKK